MNGIWKYTLGTPEEKTPVSIFREDLNFGEQKLPDVTIPPFSLSDVTFETNARGCVLTLPMEASEQFFGLGLQLKSVNQTWKKKCLRVNSDPVADTGDSHAPVPFYLSTKGYGVLIDTARYASFYFGTHVKNSTNIHEKVDCAADNTADLYGVRENQGDQRVIIDIPAAKGVDVYLFGGPDMLTAVQRYNLFSGGGCMPPMWGLGVWYRAYVNAQEKDIEQLSADLRSDHMPCDVLGMEPGWQTHYYSCSYIWNEEKFPHYQKMIDGLNEKGYHVNLWEHIFIHPTATIYDELLALSGDYRVWDGLVPDFSLPEAAKIFCNYHQKTFVEKGISGFKFDECDNSDFITSPWSYPEVSAFPSGMDGEQMHSVMGLLYQKMIMPAFEKTNHRTYGGVRSSHALAAPMPFVLYSDLYDHGDFVRGMVNMGYSGLLWTPEVRQCHSAEELIRRLQSVVFSPMALVNGWMIPNPPWKQFDEEKNKAGIFLEDSESLQENCKKILNLRMKLLPYLYSAFYQYTITGKPPFRGLPLDYPEDVNTYQIEDSYMVGDSLLFAPVFEGQKGREVYLPTGKWYHYFTHEAYAGGKTYFFDTAIEDMLLFVKENSILPLAQPVEYVTEDTVFDITLMKFGTSGSCVLVEDDGVSFDYRMGKFNLITIDWNGTEQPSISRCGLFETVRYQFNQFVWLSED